MANTIYTGPLQSPEKSWFQKLLESISGSQPTTSSIPGTTYNQPQTSGVVGNPAVLGATSDPNYSSYQPFVGPQLPSGSFSTGTGNPVTGGTGGTTPSGAVTDPNAGQSMQSIYEQQLNAARNQARNVASQGYDRAKGIYDEGLGLLNKRRGEFQDIFNTGRENILGGYEKGRGELQAADQGAETKMANAMRALGLGGSAYVKSEGAARQNAAKALGGLQTERNNNETANTTQFNTNQDWANTQEGALSRGLQDAGNLRSNAESSADIGYLGDMGNLFNTILSNQLATKAAAGSYTANPYAVNISSMADALNGNTPTINGGTTGTDQGANVVQNPTTLALLKKQRSGVAGAGLYA